MNGPAVRFKVEEPEGWPRAGVVWPMVAVVPRRGVLRSERTGVLPVRMPNIGLSLIQFGEDLLGTLKTEWLVGGAGDELTVPCRILLGLIGGLER
jgi:hypothetical protein